jgi:hypothetical protein
MRASDLLEGATQVIEVWLAQTDPLRSLQALQAAVDVGGRALIASDEFDTVAAERYRHSLMRLKKEMPLIEERFKDQRTKLLRERETLERALQWSSECRESV